MDGGYSRDTDTRGVGGCGGSGEGTMDGGYSRDTDTRGVGGCGGSGEGTMDGGYSRDTLETHTHWKGEGARGQWKEGRGRRRQSRGMATAHLYI